MTEQPPVGVIEIAVQQSQCSPCQSKRGAVIYRERFDGVHILGRGQNHKTDRSCDGSDRCKATCRVDALHAEQMALLNTSGHANCADLVHVKTVDGALVPSGEPSCVECSKLLMAAGIAGVWLYHADGWRRYEAAEFHRLSLIARLSSLTPDAPTQKGR